MTIRKFVRLLAEKEGKKKQQSIAQLSETLKCANDLTRGLLYELIRAL